MTFSARIYKPCLVALAALLLFVSGQMQNGLNIDRKAMGLTKMPPLVNAPPMLAFTTVALGSFRGLIANALWMRLSDLQLDDKYYEMVQLSDWITKLQPHMIAVWQFQSWNMAWNVSVKFKSHEDRWQWVKRGIELLRDQGLKLNPNETKLYRDLSWIFQFKVGANLDDAHMTYKLHWAQEMQNVLGGRPNFAELENPTTPEWKARAEKLRDVYKMDPKIIEKVDKEYGPFDWRLPDAHAVYWAEMGRIYARPEDQETLRRSIYQSLQQMGIRGGALDKSVTNVTPQNFILWPNLDRIPVINATYLKMIAEDTNKVTYNLKGNMETAHKNFLKQMIPLLYESGRPADAQYWYDYVKKLYTNSFVGKEAGMDMETYSVSQIMPDMSETDQNKVEAAIIGFFDQEFYCLVRDNDDQALNYDNLAIKVYKHYNLKTAGASKERLQLRPLPVLRKFALEKFLDPQSHILSPAGRALLRTKLRLPAEAAAPPPVINPAPAPAG